MPAPTVPISQKKNLPLLLLAVSLLFTVLLWQFSATSALFDASASQFLSPGILFSGTCISALIFILAREKEKKYQLALILAQEMTVALTASKSQADKLIRKIEMILNSAGEGILGIDVAGCGVFVNPAACDMLGCQPHEFVGQTVNLCIHQRCLHDSSAEAGTCFILQTLQTGHVHKAAEEIFWRKGGIPFPVEYTSMPMWDESGGLTGAVVTFNDITERLLSQKDRCVRQAAEQANKAKSGFLAMMSHEIRTPMNAVLGCTQLLSNSPSFSSRDRELLKTIERSGEHLLALINDILDISKLEAGNVPINNSVCNLPDLLQNIKALLLLPAENKGLRFFVDYDEDLPRYVLTDGVKLQAILVNLLGNGIKFTERGSVVLRVHVESHQGNNLDVRSDLPLLFTVEDTGPGIRQQDMKKIFAPFEQAESGVKAGGTGLGLPISSKLAQLMGGSLSVESEVGQGSRFLLRIRVLPGDGTVGLEEKAIEKERIIGLEWGAESGATPPTILVVDDSESNRLYLRRILEMNDFVVTEAANGLEALNSFQQCVPNAVLMDIQMPIMDGFEATRQIKFNSREWAAVPIIAITGNVFEVDRQQGQAAGMSAYLCKPFSTAELFFALGTCLNLPYKYQPDNCGVDSGSSPLTPAHLAELSKEVANDISQAVEAGDIGRLRELIAGINEYNSRVALGLQTLVDQYDYEKLLDLLAQGERKASVEDNRGGNNNEKLA